MTEDRGGRVAVRIDRVVLHGVAASDAPLVAASFREELERLLSGPPSGTRSDERGPVETMTTTAHHRAGPEGIGRAAAHGLHGRLRL